MADERDNNVDETVLDFTKTKEIIKDLHMIKRTLKELESKTSVSVSKADEVSAALENVWEIEKVSSELNSKYLQSDKRALDTMMQMSQADAAELKARINMILIKNL
jgi:hypothetical protein